MLIFARRRLQYMFDSIQSSLTEEKARDLLARLEDKRVEQALPAEMELGLVWALSTLGEVDIEPEWWGDTRRPDVYTEALIRGKPTAIEIAAPSDNTLSGEDAMDAIAQEISDFANKIKKRFGRYLYFRFGETSGYKDNKYYRYRLAPKEFKISSEVGKKIRDWVFSDPNEHQSLILQDKGLYVEINKRPYPQKRHFNVWSSMPPQTFSVDENHLFELLKRKARQLRAASGSTFRLIFLCDAGSTLIKQIGTSSEFDPMRRVISGRQIISHFIKLYSDQVDGVVTFAPARQDSHAVLDRHMKWSVGLFTTEQLAHEIGAAVDNLIQAMPTPIFDGHQARSLFRQKAYIPSARGQYRATIFGGNMRENSYYAKIPARALVDLLADRITLDQFRFFTGDNGDKDNIFKEWLEKGMTIESIEFSGRTLDNDDDYITITFSDDPAARTLRVNRT
jgi:hypothetical protein